MCNVGIWSGYGGWLLVVDLDIKPCHSLGWVTCGKEQMGEMSEFHFGHVDAKYYGTSRKRNFTWRHRFQWHCSGVVVKTMGIAEMIERELMEQD